MPEKSKEQNLWRCPRCDRVVDYGPDTPSDGQTHCDATGTMVQMIKVEKETAE